MSVIVRWTIGLALALAALGPATDAVDGLEPNQQLYRLVMTRCASAGRYVQSAFKPAGIPALITALHGVAGCQAIQVYDAHGSPGFGGRTFRVGRADVRYDVAEIVANPPLSAEGGFPVAPREPSARDHLVVFGFPDGRTLSRGTAVDVAIPALMPLRTWHFPLAIHRALEARKSPDLDVAFVDIDGVLMPGHSGAPLLNAGNQVVAVANGGLNGGTDHRTWAAPWARIELRAFDDATAQRLGQAPESLFAYEIEGDDATPTVSELRPAETRTTVTLEPDGQIPGLAGHLTARLDGAGRAFLYSRNMAIDGGQSQPVPIAVSHTVQLEDSLGNRAALTIAAITPNGISGSSEPLVSNRRHTVDRFEVSITDQAGSPLPRATVQVAFADGTYRSAQSDERGQAMFDQLKLRTADVIVSHPAFIPASAPAHDIGRPLAVRLHPGSSALVPGGTEPGTPIVFIVDGNGVFDPTISGAIARVLGGRAGAFTSQFITSGAFVRVWDGDLRALPAQSAASGVSEMWFGRSTVSFAASDEPVAGLRRAELTIALRRYRFVPQLLTDVMTSSAVGAGYSDEQALQIASEHLASQLRIDRR